MRPNHISAVYKRLSTRDLMDPFDRDDEENAGRLLKSTATEGGNCNPLWKLSLPHVCVATISSFLFGYHLGVVNEPLESISLDLGFAGNTLAEGFVVSMCLGGAFVGCLCSGWIADDIGRRRAFQLSTIPLIVGACFSASASNLQGMLLGRFLVGTGMGLGPPVAALYVAEVSPPFLRGTYGSFIQIATCLGLIGALLFGILVKEAGGWRVCFWVAVPPAALLALCMDFCAESPHWLYKVVYFFVGLLFLQLLDLLGTKVLYSIFASFCLIAAAFVRRNVVETKGRSLQEIEISLLPLE